MTKSKEIDFIIEDGNAENTESENIIKQTLDWWTKEHPEMPKINPRFVLRSRVCEEDLTGVILAKELNPEFLTLPINFQGEDLPDNVFKKALESKDYKKLGEPMDFQD